MSISQDTIQPRERKTLGFEFSGKLASGVTLSSGTLTATDTEAGTDVSSTVLLSTAAAIVSTQTQFTVLSSVLTNGRRYQIHCVAVLSNNDRLEEDLVLLCREN